MITIKEMQIKTTLTFHLSPVRIAIIKNTTGVGKDAGERNPGALLVGIQTSTTTLEKNLEASMIQQSHSWGYTQRT
jgi:hypothetical protein